MDKKFVDELQRVIMDVRYEHKMMEEFETASLEDLAADKEQECLTIDETEYIVDDDIPLENVERWEVARDRYGNIIGASPIYYGINNHGFTR